MPAQLTKEEALTRIAAKSPGITVLADPQVSAKLRHPLVEVLSRIAEGN